MKVIKRFEHNGKLLEVESEHKIEDVVASALKLIDPLLPK